MVIIATGLIVLGGLSALMGAKLFRLLLPILGFVSGVMIGFGGTQAVYGSNVVSTAVSLVVALVLGVVMMALSLMFYEVAVTVLTVWMGVTAFTYLGLALGLQNFGFVLFLMALAGGFIGLVISSNLTWPVDFVISLTSLLGVSFIFAGVLLLVGDLSVSDLDNNGIVNSVLNNIDQSFLWMFAWLGGSLLAVNLQRRMLELEVLGDVLEFKPNKVSRSN